jgi:hypothetical protein
MEMNQRDVNGLVLIVFAPLLIVIGVLGFLVPSESGMTSGAAPYNIFHILFGIIGIAILWLMQERGAIIFNLGFGLIDLYQAVASYADLFPKNYFRWTRVDDILHVIVGSFLVFSGLYGAFVQRSDKKG